MIALIAHRFEVAAPFRTAKQTTHRRHLARTSSIGRSGRLFIEAASAAVLLLLASPVIGVAALLIRLTSKGPAFFSQVRLGKNGKEFSLLKLRTMYHDCERLTGACWSVPGDSRITAVGRLLRKLHIDELPQLWNVVEGKMRFVGPRPERPEIVAKLVESIAGYARRLQVAPGITGLAQVLLPPDVSLHSVRRKLAYDVYFIENSRFDLYVRILLGTVLHVMRVPFTAIRVSLALPSLEQDGRVDADRLEEKATYLPHFRWSDYLPSR